MVPPARKESPAEAGQELILEGNQGKVIRAANIRAE
jgi:hypothetical protein